MLNYQATHQTYTELVGAFHILREEHAQVSQALQQKAAKMELEGELVEEEDVRRLHQFFLKTQEIQATLAKLGNLLFGEQKPWPELESFNNLEQGLQAIAEALDHPEINLLTHARCITVRPGRSVTKLNELYERIDALVGVLQSASPTEIRARIEQARDLIEGVDAMVRIVEEGEHLEDAICEALREVATRVFDKTLVISALRGHLMLGQPQASPLAAYRPERLETTTSQAVYQPRVIFEEPEPYPSALQGVLGSEDIPSQFLEDAEAPTKQESPLAPTLVSSARAEAELTPSSSVADSSAPTDSIALQEAESATTSRRRRRPIFTDWGTHPSQEAEDSASSSSEVKTSESNPTSSSADIKKNEKNGVEPSAQALKKQPFQEKEAPSQEPFPSRISGELASSVQASLVDDKTPHDDEKISTHADESLVTFTSTASDSTTLGSKQSSEETAPAIDYRPLPILYSMTAQQIQVADELTEIEKIFTLHANHEIIMAALMRHSIGHLHFTNLPSEKAEEAAQALQTWFSMETDRHAMPGDIGHMLGVFGLQIQNAEAQDSSGSHFTVHATPPDPSFLLSYFSPIWQQALYRVSCFWGNPPESMLWEQLKKIEEHKAAPVFFYFGVLTSQQRQQLAKGCRTHQRELLIIDNTLALHLCITPEEPLKTLLGSILPYGYYSN